MQIDVMDGLFVANYGYSMNAVLELKEYIGFPFGFNLMVKDLEYILS